MKRLVFKEPQVNMDYLSDDINKLQSEFNKRGYEISRTDVYKFCKSLGGNKAC